MDKHIITKYKLQCNSDAEALTTEELEHDADKDNQVYITEHGEEVQG